MIFGYSKPNNWSIVSELALKNENLVNSMVWYLCKICHDTYTITGYVMHKGTEKDHPSYCNLKAVPWGYFVWKHNIHTTHSPFLPWFQLEESLAGGQKVRSLALWAQSLLVPYLVAEVDAWGNVHAHQKCDFPNNMRWSNKRHWYSLGILPLM